MRRILLFTFAIALGVVVLVLRERGQAPLPEGPSPDVHPTPDGAAEVEAVAEEETGNRIPVTVPRDPAPATETRAFVVDVKVTKYLTRNSEPVTGVAVVGGLARGWRSYGAALVGATREFEGTVDGEGHLQVSLDVPTAWYAEEERRVDEKPSTGGVLTAQRGVFVWAQVEDSGFQSRTRAVPLAEHADAPVLLRIQAVAGVTVRGHVRTEDGRPGANATVRALQSDPDEAGALDQVSRSIADGEGAFALHFEAPGVYAFQAFCPGLGASFLPDVDVPRIPSPLDLVLRGAGVLAGRLVDPQGRPVRNHRLWALPADWEGTRLHENSRIRLVRGDGLIDGQATTDRDGRFRVSGLQPGAYGIRAFDGLEREFGPLLTGPGGVRTGTEDLELVLARHALVVRVLDEHGALQHPTVLPRYRPSLAGELSLVCVRADADGQVTPDSAWRHVSFEVAENGEVVFELEAEATYRIGVLSPRHPLQERVVWLAGTRYEETIEFVLPPPVPPGVLELTIATPDGEPFDEDVTVVLRSPESGARVLLSDDYAKGPEFRAELPPGIYDLTVDAEPPTGHHGERFETTPYTPVHDQVLLRAGETTSREVRLGASGKLVIAFTLPDGWQSVPVEGEVPDEDWENLRRRMGGAKIVLRPVEGGPEWRPEFDITYVRGLDLPPVLGALQTPWAPPGVEVQAVNPLPIGRYAAELQAPGCEPHTEEIEIAAGETTRIEAKLAAR